MIKIFNNTEKQYSAIQKSKFPIRLFWSNNPIDTSYLSRWGLNGIISKESGEWTLYESRCCQPDFLDSPSTDALTWQEVILEELRGLESGIGKKGKILFSLPAQLEPEKQAKTLLYLTLHASEKTLLTFPAFLKRVLHPFWKLLEKEQEPIETGLLPYLELGNGLAVPIDLIDNMMHRLTHHHFVGAAAKVDFISVEDYCLDWGLWVFGQTLKTGESVSLLAEKWCETFHPIWNRDQALKVIRMASSIESELLELKDPEKKPLREGYLRYRLEALQSIATLADLQPAVEKFKKEVKDG